MIRVLINESLLGLYFASDFSLQTSEKIVDDIYHNGRFYFHNFA